MAASENQAQGKIVVHKKASYEILDQEEREMINNLKQQYIGGPNAKMSSDLCEYLRSCSDPFDKILKLTYNSRDFNIPRPKTLSFFLISTFSTWLQIEQVPPLTNMETKLDAMKLVFEDKTLRLCSSLVSSFNLVESNEEFLPLIYENLEKKNYKQVSNVVSTLKLQRKFSPEDFLIPLWLQDKLNTVDDYLRTDDKSLIEFLTYLDNLLVSDINTVLQTIVESKKITGWNPKNYNGRTIVKWMSRLIKKNKLQALTFPNMVRRQQKAAFSYVMSKRFETGEDLTEGWAEMVLEAIGNSQELECELVKIIFRRGLMEEAKYWVSRFGLPEDLWPPGLSSFIRDESVPALSLSPKAGPSASSNFLTLPIGTENVVFVNNPNLFNNFVNEMNKADIIGFDAEWKPAFGSKQNQVSLIQFATKSHVFILDRPTLTELYPEFASLLVEEVLHNKDISKIGFDIANDIRILSTTFPTLKAITNLTDLFTLRNYLEEECKFKFPFSELEKGSKGLKNLVEITLGKTLDKTEQCSNWDNRPLRPAQVDYAALDAYCLLPIFEVLREESEKQNLVWDDVLRVVKEGRSPYKKLLNENKMVKAADVRVICTWELIRLARRLRRCGINTEYNDAAHLTKRLMRLARKQYRLLTTVKSPLHHIPMMKVPVMDEQSQLHYVLRSLKVELTYDDFNARCYECNGAEFTELTKEAAIYVAKSTAPMKIQMVPAEEMLSHDYDDEDDDDFDIGEEEEDFDSYRPVQRAVPDKMESVNFWTSTGVAIKADKIPADVLETVDMFKVCVNCGTVLWPVTLESMFLYD